MKSTSCKDIAQDVLDQCLAGKPPKVLTAAAVVGGARAAELFEAAYDEHSRRLARLYEGL